MILLRLLDHDLHSTRGNVSAVPLWIETPAKPSFLPAVISASSPKFLVSRKLTSDNKLRSGVFKYYSDLIDDVLGDLIASAYELSQKENWSNIFIGGKKPYHAAFDFVQKTAGLVHQPHMVLVPEGKGMTNFVKLLGKDCIDGVFRKVCRVIPCKVAFPVFCSRPDFVGMYTQFMGGRSSILLHNVKNGLAFCPPSGGD